MNRKAPFIRFNVESDAAQKGMLADSKSELNNLIIKVKVEMASVCHKNVIVTSNQS